MVSKEDELEKTFVSGSETFNGKVRAAGDSPATLVVLIGPTGYVGKQFALIDPEYTLGRSIECEIYIDDKSVSRNHARLTISGKDVFIQDLGSSNKTIVNSCELKLNMPIKLKNNDQVKTGDVIFKFLESGNLEAVTNRQLNEKAQKDALTGIWSKGALLEKGAEAMKRSDMLSEDLSILAFDLDFFKKINDVFGHPGGDYVLKEMAGLVSTKVVRTNDFFARYGGEEFVILLPNAKSKTALDVAERLRTTIETHSFQFQGQKISVTISVGCATKNSSDKNWESIFKRADDALYKSKRNGRNQVNFSN